VLAAALEAEKDRSYREAEEFLNSIIRAADREIRRREILT